MSGRTTWRAKPCGWRDRERVVALGEEFGPAGPLVLDVLEELAKEQRGDEGRIRTGLRSLSRAAFLPRGTEGAELARRVLAFGAEVGALDDLVIAEDADMTVTCRVSGFAADQGRGYEAVRKAQLRGESGPDTRDNGGACPDDGDGVPVCPPTGQDRTGEEPSSLRSDGSARARPDDDRWPERLSEEKHPLAAVVHQRLAEVADVKGGKAPSRRRVGEIVADFPEHDHRLIVGEFADYWLHGGGERTLRADWGRTYRDRCKRLVASPGLRPAPGPVASADAFRRHREEIRRREEAALAAFDEEAG